MGVKSLSNRYLSPLPNVWQFFARYVADVFILRRYFFVLYRAVTCLIMYYSLVKPKKKVYNNVNRQIRISQSPQVACHHVLGDLHTGFITFAHDAREVPKYRLLPVCGLGTDILRRRSVFFRGCLFFRHVKPTPGMCRLNEGADCGPSVPLSLSRSISLFYRTFRFFEVSRVRILSPPPGPDQSGGNWFLRVCPIAVFFRGAKWRRGTQIVHVRVRASKTLGAQSNYIR